MCVPKRIAANVQTRVLFRNIQTQWTSPYPNSSSPDQRAWVALRDPERVDSRVEVYVNLINPSSKEGAASRQTEVPTGRSGFFAGFLHHRLREREDRARRVTRFFFPRRTHLLRLASLSFSLDVFVDSSSSLLLLFPMPSRDGLWVGGWLCKEPRPWFALDPDRRRAEVSKRRKGEGRRKKWLMLITWAGMT